MKLPAVRLSVCPSLAMNKGPLNGCVLVCVCVFSPRPCTQLVVSNTHAAHWLTQMSWNCALTRRNSGSLFIVR